MLKPLKHSSGAALKSPQGQSQTSTSQEIRLSTLCLLSEKAAQRTWERRQSLQIPL